MRLTRTSKQQAIGESLDARLTGGQDDMSHPRGVFLSEPGLAGRAAGGAIAFGPDPDMMRSRDSAAFRGYIVAIG